jgi:hypothetical protein
MNYYRCSTNDIHIEIQRRGYNVSGSRDQLSEILANDDNNRETEATTVATTVGISLPRELNLIRIGELGQTAPAVRLVNESRSRCMTASRRQACILTISRNRVLDDEFSFPDVATLF